MFTPQTCHMSGVTCHVSRVTCHVSHVTCHMSCVTCHMSKKEKLQLIIYILFYLFILFFFCKTIGQSGRASRWRACYQRGLPRLFLLLSLLKPFAGAKNLHIVCTSLTYSTTEMQLINEIKVSCKNNITCRPCSGRGGLVARQCLMFDFGDKHSPVL